MCLAPYVLHARQHNITLNFHLWNLKIINFVYSVHAFKLLILCIYCHEKCLEMSETKPLNCTYLFPGKVPAGCKTCSHSRVHVGTGDVANCIDHHSHNEATGHRRPQLRNFPFITPTQSRWSTCHKHQQVRGYNLCEHLHILL